MEHFDGSPRKSTTRLPRSATRILKNWLHANRDSPFPCKDDKLALQEQTGLSAKQISTWFINARRRREKTVSFVVNSGFDGNGFDGITDSQRQSSNEQLNWSDMTAIDRWQNSPPETEAANLADIEKALLEWQQSSADPSNDFAFLNTVSSREGSSSANSSASSVWLSNASSNETTDSVGLKGRRRRHKKKATLPRLRRKASLEKRRFQCTFCTDRFKTKYDWTRHERTQHLSLESWTCAPLGAEVLSSEGKKCCAFCDIDAPSSFHIQTIHNYNDCAEKSAEARTFYRKDHLMQHLQLVHGVEHFTSSMAEWKCEIPYVRSRCGFCSYWFSDWRSRNDHLAEHFRDGINMASWTGDRGFDAHIANMVQNSMPPYLIGEEAVTMHPFSTEKLNEKERAQHWMHSGAPVETQLGDFINDYKTVNNDEVPTDEMLQRQARLIVFGEDDSWNQTAADNEQWLKMFKARHELNSKRGPDAEREIERDDRVQPHEQVWARETAFPVPEGWGGETISTAPGAWGGETAFPPPGHLYADSAFAPPGFLSGNYGRMANAKGQEYPVELFGLPSGGLETAWQSGEEFTSDFVFEPGVDF